MCVCNLKFLGLFLTILVNVEGPAPYYNVCINFAGLNTDYRNCLYAAPRPNVSRSRDIIYPDEIRQRIYQWCSITSPWQRDCFRTVTSHCDNAQALSDLAERSGLCNGTRPASWVQEYITHFTELDRTCPRRLPVSRPEFAVDAPNIESFQRTQQENFDIYATNMFFQSMSSRCYHKMQLFFYRLVSDLMTSDLGVGIFGDTENGLNYYWF